MKITSYRQLDELVARGLGWKCFTKGFVVGYVPSNIWDDSDNPIQLEKWLTNQDYYTKGYICPTFSTELDNAECVLDYLRNQDFQVVIQSDSKVTKLFLRTRDKDGYYNFCGDIVVICGEQDTLTLPDSTVNSIPLAISLAFLKYKQVEVELDLKT